ncbi:MAG TPA: immunoglobulin domain-containing protein [Verrucomicrobiae bacterium]|nr:immunoglobulin domain-containing protein [Verrucomicrobiae bacterium]
MKTPSSQIKSKIAELFFPRRRIIGLLVALSTSALTFSSNANLLFNGNLDETSVSSQVNASPTGWIIDASKTVSGTFNDGADSETWCNVVDTNGYGLFFKPFQGNATTGDLLNVKFYQDNSATPGTKFTLSFYASGEAHYSGFFKTNSPNPETLAVIEFLDGTGTVLATNTFDLVAAGLPNTGPGGMAGFHYTTPQVTAPTNTTTVRAGCFILNVYNTTGAQSFFTDGFDLESVAPPGSPVITTQPVQTSIGPGSNVTFSVVVSNTTGVTYQWQFYGTNLANGGNVSGATTSSLKITGVSAAEAGHYRVLVSNAAGSVYSSDATLSVVGINFFPVISLSGRVGDTYRIDYALSVTPTNWVALSTNVLTSPTQMFIDTTSPRANNRFYRAVFLH